MTNKNKKPLKHAIETEENFHGPISFQCTLKRIFWRARIILPYLLRADRSVNSASQQGRTAWYGCTSL